MMNREVPASSLMPVGVELSESVKDLIARGMAVQAAVYGLQLSEDYDMDELTGMYYTYIRTGEW